MKKIIAIILFGLLPVVGLSQDKAVEKLKPSDEFMAFVVEKAKLYTEKGEMAISKSVDFVMQEAKPTAEEFIKWRIISHLIDAAPTIIIFCLFSGTFLFVLLFKNKYILDFTGWTSVFIFCGLGTVFTCIPMFADAPRGTSVIQDIKLATQAYVAPRIYIIEQVAQFIKEKK